MRVVSCLLPALSALVVLTPRSLAETIHVARSPADQSRQARLAIYPPPTNITTLTFAEFRARAAQFNAAVTLPRFESTVQSIQRSVSNTLRGANLSLQEIVGCRHDHLTFDNTIGALDDVRYDVRLTENRLNLIKETSTNAALREAAMEGAKALSAWQVGLDYREDVHRAVSKYAESEPLLEGEEARLFDRVMRDYRRAGLDLPEESRDAVEKQRRELSGLVADFEANITKARQAVKFTGAELAGVPSDFLAMDGIKTGSDEFTILANVTFQYVTVMENARLEATRRRLAEIQANLARETNGPLLQRIVELRDTIARRLGYANWADYQIEVKMARTATNALAFCERMRRALDSKFTDEQAEFQRMKAAETGDASARIQFWDWRYYSHRLKNERHGVHADSLRVYFPLEQCLVGMFHVSERLFGLRFERIEPVRKWCNDLRLYAVSDAESGEPLGLVYFDLFPRDGKFNHFAQFPLIEGKEFPSRYQRPTVALVCNFPPPSDGRPSLLSHQEVETLFHEFGHALHSILTRARFARFSGTSVPGDFVEAPAQMLENWVWDKTTLDEFAMDYRDPNKKLPAKALAALKTAKLATAGTTYRRQLALARLDLALHTEVTAINRRNVIDLSNEMMARAFLPMPEKTAFAAYFGHLADYDAGVYGYLWSEAIAADLVSVFQRSSHGLDDKRAGRRLREEIYAPGDSRDVNVSIERFLERKQSPGPFFKTLGLPANE